MSTLRNLTDDMDYYHRAFGVYHRLANREEVYGRWIDTELREIVRGLNVTVTAEDQPMRVLSIGPGDGSIESMIFKSLRDTQDLKCHIHCTVVEPADDKVRLFQERLAREAFQEMSFDWKVQTLEDYQSTADNKDAKFHFISSIHSVSYALDLDVTLKDLYERLEPGGLMLVFVSSDGSAFGQLGKTFHYLHKGGQAPPKTADIRESFNSLGIPIFREIPMRKRVDITACFSDPEEMTEDGRLLLDFLSHALHFTRDAPDELRVKFLKVLGSDRCSEKGDGGEVSLNVDCAACIVKR